MVDGTAETERDGVASLSRVAYAIDARIPSNNGFVLQTIRMCEGFARNGVDVTLTYPRRVQTNPDLKSVHFEEYFDVSTPFDRATIPYPDPEGMPALADGRFRRVLTWIASLWFAIAVAVRYRLRPADLHVTRDWLVAYVFVLAGLPTVFEIHKTAGLSFSERGRLAIGRVADRQALRGVVTLTEPTADGLEALGIPAEKILVTPDGVDLSAYEDLPGKDRARERLGLSPDEFIVGYTGSLFEGKGPRQLVEACRSLDATVLVVGGTEQDIQSLRSLLDDEGIENVQLIGRVPPSAVSTYQAACDVLVLPPTAEGSDKKHHPEATSPLKLFEYMAAERPIVATRLPGVEDVLTNEANGLLVPPGDPEAIRDAVEQLRRDKQFRDRLARTARENVEQYTWTRRARLIAAFATDKNV